MITKDTVLVLGAGASAEYKYPLGTRLREILIRELNPSDNPPSQITTRLMQLDFGQAEIGRFKEALRGSATNSVDEFLEHFHGPSSLDELRARN